MKMIKLAFKSKISPTGMDEVVSYDKIKQSLTNNPMFGWHDYFLTDHASLVARIKSDIQFLQQKAKTMVVIGIGGSYLGSVAVDEALNSKLNKEYNLIYLGNNLDSDYFDNVIAFCQDNDFVLNVISKSGTTLEPNIAFEVIKELMIKKYGFEEFKQRTLITTDAAAKKSFLKAYADEHGLKTYAVPDDIGGRYSVFTPVGLIPIAFANIDIAKLLAGCKQASRDFYTEKNNDALKYAYFRYLEYHKHKSVEALVVYNPLLRGFIEWYKQLFAESEGKNHKGLLPIGMIYSTDLHSLGQFVQEGTPLLFETNIIFKNNKDVSLAMFQDNENFSYLSKYQLSEVNDIVRDSVIKAHFESGNVDNIIISTDELNEYHLAYMMVFLMYSCAYSASLIGVNPFDQPGVEVYKKEIKNVL